MELLDIYNNIKNPLDEPDIIDKLIDIYGDNSTLALNLYDKLINQNKEGKVIGKEYSELRNRFVYGMFNKWKHEVLSMTKEEFIDLYRRGHYPPNFPDLRNYLKTIPDAKTKEEAFEYMYGHNVPSNIKDLFEGYYWDSIGFGTGWTHVSSRNVNAKKTKQIPVEHRLYLNVDSTAIYKIAMEFISKCEEMGIPYYFKFSPIGNRDDDIVVYSDSKHLPLFIDVLKKIKEENKDLLNVYHKPPILSGKIYDWLGYGSEPEEHKSSFNSKRANAISKGIENTTKEWVKDNLIKLINFRNNFIHFYEYIALAMVESKISNLKSTYKLYDDSSRNSSKGYDPNHALDMLGVKLIDLESIEFKNYVYKKVILNMEDRIISYCENPNYEFEIDVPVRNGKSIKFNQYDMVKTFRTISPKIRDNDPEFTNKVKENIIEESKKVGIDKNKYCFDVKRVYELSNNKSISKIDIPSKQTPTIQDNQIKKAKVVEPIKVVNKRDMVIHTNYVPSQYLLGRLQELLDYNPDMVIPYLYKNMNGIRVLLPYLVENNSELADKFVDEAVYKYPEIQSIYDKAHKYILY